jgi:hypothetical protein
VRKVVLSATFTLFACTLFLMPADLYAAPFGTLTIVGTGNVRVGASFIDWGNLGPVFESSTYTNCEPGPNPGACVLDGTTDGAVFVTGGTGTFAGIAGTAGTLLDLEDDFAPSGTPFSLANFLQLSALPGVVFTATTLPLGSGTPAGCTSNPGDVCTIPGSPFTITNLTSTSSSVALTIFGTVDDGSGTPGNFIGAFSTQFDDLSAAGILAAIAANGWVESSHSADFTITPIPEPSSAVMFGAGVLLLLTSYGLRRRRTL